MSCVFDAFPLCLGVLLSGGGHVRIENVKLDFKEKAHAKVGSLDNTSHTPGGGNVVVKRSTHTSFALKVSVTVRFCRNKEKNTTLTLTLSPYPPD